MGLTFEPLGKYVRLVDERNTELVTESVLGINIDKYFMPSVANVIGTDLGNYKLLRNGRYACNPMHVGRDGRLPVARYTKVAPAIVSPAYFTFEIIDENEIEPEYLMLCFRRPDFDRMCWFRTDASVRGGITWEDVCALTIPVPPLPKQRKIVRDYQVITDRIELLREINTNLDVQMRTVFKAWFLNHACFKGEWESIALGGLVTYTQGTQIPVEEQSDNFDNNKIRFLRIVDFTGTTSDIPRYIDKRPNMSICDIQTVLMIRYGASAGQVYRGLEGVFANNLFSIIPQRIIGNGFLYYYLTQPEIQRTLISVGESSSAMPALTHGLISDLMVELPKDLSILDKYESMVSKVYHYQRAIRREMEHLGQFQHLILYDKEM